MIESGLYRRFEAPKVAARDRLEYWRAWFSSSVDVPLRIEPLCGQERVAGFDAAGEAVSADGVNLVEYRFGAAAGGWSREAIEPAHRLRLAILAPSPNATGCWHQNRLSLDRETAVLVGNTSGRWHAPHGLRGLHVSVPRDQVEVTDPQLEAFNDQRRLRKNPVFARLIRPALLALAGHLSTVADTDQPELGAIWTSLLNLLMRSLAGKDGDGTDTAAARRVQARRHIRENLADPNLCPDTVAAALHISRSTLYAALPSDQDGDGVAAEIRRQRLELAHAMLSDATDTRPIAQIAACVGLPNAAHFSRSFREHHGLSPRELRASHIAALVTVGRTRGDVRKNGRPGAERIGRPINEPAGDYAGIGLG